MHAWFWARRQEENKFGWIIWLNLRNQWTNQFANQLANQPMIYRLTRGNAKWRSTKWIQWKNLNLVGDARIKYQNEWHSANKKRMQSFLITFCPAHLTSYDNQHFFPQWTCITTISCCFWQWLYYSSLLVLIPSPTILGWFSLHFHKLAGIYQKTSWHLAITSWTYSGHWWIYKWIDRDPKHWFGYFYKQSACILSRRFWVSSRCVHVWTHIHVASCFISKSECIWE